MDTHESPASTDPVSDIFGYLRGLSSALVGGGFSTHTGYNYSSIYDFVLDRGRSYKSASLTTEERRVVRAAMGKRKFAKKECFYNAHTLVLEDTSGTLIYTEGFALSRFIPLYHGWVTINGKVVDVTWDETGRPIMGTLPEGWSYVGVEFPLRSVLRERIAHRREVHSIIDDPQDHFPVLKWPRLNPLHMG